VNALLTLSRRIDALSERVGKAAIWIVLVVVLVSAGNAVVRHMFNFSSNALLEVQWYLFGLIFFLCSGYTLLHNEHVRIDILSSRFSPRGRAWIEIFGILFFLAPMAVVILALSWPVFVHAFVSGEMSNSPGGLIVWPARLMAPVGFALLILQALSEFIKRVGFLRGLCPDPAEKRQAKIAEKDLAEEIQARQARAER
jgi:TRAP-type mannitol/chloroaromatic compound transport system permease small subunit